LSYKGTSFVLAVILSAAAPAFADNISGDLRNVESGSHPTLFSTYGNGSTVRFDSMEMKIAEVVALDHEHLRASSTLVGTFWLGSNNGIGFGKNTEKFSRKHNQKDHDGGVGPISSFSAVSVPEPGSQTLLLFGLAGLGMFFYRRSSLKQAV
jgi:hypothetical protein